MTYRMKMLLVILLLGLLSLACGLGSFGGAAEEAVEQVQEAGAQVQEQVEEASKQVEEAVEQVEEAVEQVEEAATTVTEKAEEAVEAVKEGTENMSSEMTTRALETGSIREALASFSSYRWQITAEFDGLSDGQPEQGTVTMLIEGIKTPPAFHVDMQMTGDVAAELGDTARVEFFSVDGNAYVQDPQSGEWFSVPGEGFVEDFFNDGFMDPEDIAEIPENARCDEATQMVNGIETTHCRFDQTEATEFKEANGEIWIAVDGGYPVKFLLEATDPINDDPDAPIESGTVNLSFELLELNTDFTIELPEAALNAETFESQLGGSIDPSEIDLPIMADAEIDIAMQELVSYSTKSSVEDTLAFYRAELEAGGWVADESQEFTSNEMGILVYTQENETLNLIIATEEDGSVSVLMSRE